MDTSSNKPSGQQWFEEPGVGETLACAAAALLYVATLAFGFVYDDVPQIVNNPAIHDWRSLPQYFTAHVWAAIFPNIAGNYYRPLFLLWFRLNYVLFGTSAYGWHLTSVLCHVCVTWLTLRLALRLTGDRLTAFFCALIFALYPAHVENVAWVSGVTDSLVTCFLLSSFLLLVGSPVTSVRRIGSLILFVLALLSKETAVILPVLVFVYGAVAEKGTDSRQSSSFAAARRISLPYVLVLLTYGVVRYVVLHGWSHATVSLRWTQVLLTWPSVLWFYVRHLCLPFRTSEFYSLDYVGAFSWSVVLPLLLVAFAASLILLLTRAIAKKDESYKVAMLISVSLIVLPLIPVLDLRSLTAGDIVHDRYLYLPSVGFALLSAISIRALFQKRFAAQFVFMGMMTVFFAAIVVHEEMQWADDIALYTRGIQSAPNNLTVRDNLANALLDKHPEKSLSLYAEVLKRNPRFWRTNYNLGVAYYKLAEYPAAEGQLQQAIQVDSEDADQYIYLALTETRLQKLREAKKDAEMAIARNPNGRGYHAVLGMICEAAADRTTAMEEFKSELAAHPDNASAAAALEKLEQGSGPQR